MATRKDYIETAKILSLYHKEPNHFYLVKDFSRLFAEDNSNFDKEKFEKACGL